MGALIRARRKALGLTLQELQRLTGINNGNLSKIERGEQSLTNKTMTALSRALDLPLFAEVRAQTATLDNNSASDAGNPYRFVREFDSLSQISQDENVAIGIIGVRPDLAHGGVAFDVDDRIAHLFHGGSIASLGSAPVNLAHYPVPNNLMAPRILAGDVVVLDLGDTTVPPEGGVFGIVMDGETVQIRRLFPFMKGGLRIICDAEKGEPEITLNAQQAAVVAIAGRVKHLQGNSGF
jgi:transcriptional regulator with XRE-family HTH domain